MTISEFAYILDDKFTLVLQPLTDNNKRLLKDYLLKHIDEYGLESTEMYVRTHDPSIMIPVRKFTDELKDIFGQCIVQKTVNDVYDKNTLIIYFT